MARKGKGDDKLYESTKVGSHAAIWVTETVLECTAESLKSLKLDWSIGQIQGRPQAAPRHREPVR